MPKVSIIIPVYNAEKFLATTLDSAISQTFTELEIVCVDDGSTDTSSQILQKYQNQDKRIKIINQKNSGGSGARNTGIEHATGEYVMFLDSDDIYSKELVASVYNRAAKTGADIVFYNFARFVGRPSKLAVVSKLTPGQNVQLFTKDEYASRLFNDFAIITWNKLVKRSVITKSKLTFDEGLSHNHDVDFSIRLMLAAKTYSYINMVGYYYRNNEGGITATKRSDPTNVLRILISLNKLVVSKYGNLKQSFDNYVVDMIVGTLAKYGGSSEKQKEVFDFAHNVAIPSVGLDKKDNSYIYDGPSRAAFGFVQAGEYDEFLTYTNTAKRKLRVRLRKIYDTVQSVLSRFTV